jgi:hypothetical protein
MATRPSSPAATARSSDPSSLPPYEVRQHKSLLILSLPQDRDRGHPGSVCVSDRRVPGAGAVAAVAGRGGVRDGLHGQHRVPRGRGAWPPPHHPRFLPA